MALYQLQRSISEFLIRQNYSKLSPVLLGLSGGPDSLALFYLLLELRKEGKIEFAVAHVDHRWRSSSAIEARELEDLVINQGIKFYLKVLEKDKFIGNKEAYCRRQRLDFFKSLAQQQGFEAVMLAHHSDDQAETVLKRVLEGAALTSMESMCEVQIIEGLAFWRPFLSISKKEILDFIALKKIEPFDDETNRDPRYLRAKFRTRIIPWLEQEFGKNVSSTLNRLSREARELTAYLDERVQKHLSNIIKGPFGMMLDLKECASLPKVELKHLLRLLLERMKLTVSYHELDLASELITSKKSDKQIRGHHSLIQIDRGCIFLLKEHQVSYPECLALSIGSSRYGHWSVQVEQAAFKQEASQSATDWLSAWKGEMRVLLPQGKYQLQFAQPKEAYPGRSTISKWWADAKIPAFFRNAIPVICQDGAIVYEFLTGRQKFVFEEGAVGVLVRLWARECE